MDAGGVSAALMEVSLGFHLPFQASGHGENTMV
jgi:hypothetical protein